MTRPRRVGILGGMGPEATVLLMQKLVAAVPAQDDADHIPLIVDQNSQVPSRIRYLIDGTGEDPAPVIVDMAQRLQAAGAEALAMPCNTAHHYTHAIRSAVKIPFIDMVALSVARAKTLAGDAPVGILASPAVRRIGLFDRALMRHGLATIYPDDGEAMLPLIKRVKAQGPDPDSRAGLAAASAALLARGARVQMIACTEFSLLADAAVPQAEVLDTLDCLVEGICAFSLLYRSSRPIE